MKTKYAMDQDLSVSDTVAPCSPCIFCGRVGDEDLSASNEVMMCGATPCRISDEELSVSDDYPVPCAPCRINDEELSASGSAIAPYPPCTGCRIDA